MSKSPSLKRNDFIMVDHLQAAWRQAIVEGMDPHLGIEREKRMFSLIGECDPSPSRCYLSWLSRWRRRAWALHGLREPCSIDDLQEISHALAAFEQARPWMPAEHRDINRCETAADLLAASTKTNLSSRRMRSIERDAALTQCDILFDQGKWKLVRLLSHEAAMWWGKGTRWCTATGRDEHYKRYVSNGDLLVLQTPSGKYQLATGCGEFRDASDRPACLHGVLRGAAPPLKTFLSMAM
ncbi:hypothetical protein [Devosia sp. Leaf420]|uniref:hypothetical protein n=1 Tax=Devosia sp. Leaf420 TaxID=1736374 RepID=UPI00078206D6|nr:hypothetical protein [Devosia sp. Leaf420]